MLVCSYFSCRSVIKCHEVTTVNTLLVLIYVCSYNSVNTINIFTAYIVTKCETISAHMLPDSQPLKAPHHIPPSSHMIPISTLHPLIVLSQFDNHVDTNTQNQPCAADTLCDCHC